jgi:hypothetical protein
LTDIIYKVPKYTISFYHLKKKADLAFLNRQGKTLKYSPAECKEDGHTIKNMYFQHVLSPGRRWEFFSSPPHPDRAHLVAYPMGTWGSFPEGNAAGE